MSALDNRPSKDPDFNPGSQTVPLETQRQYWARASRDSFPDDTARHTCRERRFSEVLLTLFLRIQGIHHQVPHCTYWHLFRRHLPHRDGTAELFAERVQERPAGFCFKAAREAAASDVVGEQDNRDAGGFLFGL